MVGLVVGLVVGLAIGGVVSTRGEVAIGFSGWSLWEVLRAKGDGINQINR